MDISHLLTLTESPSNLIIRAVVVYIWVLLLVRISGKRQIGQMGATEFVAILLISNAVQNSMNGGDNSLVGGLLLAAILIAVSWTISLLSYHFRRVQIIFEGTPTLLIHNGKIIIKHLEKERIRKSELITLLRKQGIHSFDEIDNAVLESDGTLSVTKVNEVNRGPRSV